MTYKIKVNKDQEIFGRSKLFNVYLQCVFHGIRFKVNEENWLSGDSQFLFYAPSTIYPAVAVALDLVQPKQGHAAKHPLPL